MSLRCTPSERMVPCAAATTDNVVRSDAVQTLPRGTVCLVVSGDGQRVLIRIVFVVFVVAAFILLFLFESCGVINITHTFIVRR